MTVFGFIYSFHMPLFIFISGYFTKSITWSKYKKSFVSIMAVYWVFQTLFMIPSWIDGSFSWIDYLTNPRSVLWYIIGLLFWRLWFAILPKKFIKFPLIMGGALVLAYGIHAVNDQNYFYTRILTFYPYFILGYFCPKEIITKIREGKKVFSIVFLAILLVALYFFVDYTLIFSMFGGMPYKHYSSVLVGVGQITLCYILAILASMSVINLCTERFYKLGSSTLDIYLIHPFYIYYVYGLIISYYGWNPNLLIDLIISVVIILICVFVSRLKITKYLTDPVNSFKALAKQKTAI